MPEEGIGRKSQGTATRRSSTRESFELGTGRPLSGAEGSRPDEALRADQGARVGKAKLVPVPVLLSRLEHVGNPLAVARVVIQKLVEWNPLCQANALDHERLVDEPLKLEVWVVRKAGVRAGVPDADAHLEKAGCVAVSIHDVR
jgi:hypothetical protein